MTVGIYVRVSTNEQVREGYSIDTQIRLLKMYCETQGWENIKIYSDGGYSAKDTDRPQFQKLKSDIKKKRISVLLVYKLDRMTRSVRDLFDILSFLEEHNCAFKSATEQYDTTTAMGRMFIGLVGLMAQWERENLGERVAITMKQKILIDNEASGAQPFGYKIVDKKRVINEEEKEVVLQMIALFKSLGSVAGVAKELNRLNIPTRTKRTHWSHQTVRQVLRNPALCGTVVYDGETAEDAFEGIITKDEFLDLSRRIEKQNLIRLKSPTRGLFSGILKCPQCSKTLVKTGARYRCNYCYESGQGFVRVKESDIKDVFIEYIKNEKELDPADAKKEKSNTVNVEKTIERLQQKRIRVQRMYADEHMTYEEFQKDIKENKLEIINLREQLDEQEYEMNVVDLNKFRWTLSENFETLTREESIEFMNLFIKEITFERKCIKRDKNGRPLGYAYTITGIKRNRL